jgi:hypothetical protein
LRRIRVAGARFCVHDSDAGTQQAASHGCATNIISHVHSSFMEKQSLKITSVYSWCISTGCALRLSTKLLIRPRHSCSPHRRGPGSRPGLASGICGGQSGVGTGFLLVLRFPLPKPFIPPTSPSSKSPGVGTIGQKWPQCRVGRVWTPRPNIKRKKLANTNVGWMRHRIKT